MEMINMPNNNIATKRFNGKEYLLFDKSLNKERQLKIQKALENNGSLIKLEQKGEVWYLWINDEYAR
jgi:hypothetical protein